MDNIDKELLDGYLEKIIDIEKMNTEHEKSKMKLKRENEIINVLISSSDNQSKKYYETIRRRNEELLVSDTLHFDALGPYGLKLVYNSMVEFLKENNKLLGLT